jgi:Uma2 family endonuclease
MTDASIPQRDLTIEEYLEHERNASARHDLIAGARFPVAEASPRHDRIVENIYRKLSEDTEWARQSEYAGDTPYRVVRTTARLSTPIGSIYYPDVMVLPDDGNEAPPIEHEPCVIVEVVSPETDEIDRQEKWAAYHNIPSLRAYLTVDQDRQRVRSAVRLSDGKWIFTSEVDVGEVRLPCPPGAYIYLADIYRDV